MGAKQLAKEVKSLASKNSDLKDQLKHLSQKRNELERTNVSEPPPGAQG